MLKSYELNKWHKGTPPGVKQRLKCPNCKKSRTIRVERENDDTPMFEKMNLKRKNEFNRGEIIQWSYNGYGHFCSLRCGTEYANTKIDQDIVKFEKVMQA